MPEPLSDVAAELRALLLDPGLRRAVAAGRRRGAEPPAWRRVELRPVQLKGGRHLQEVRYDARSAHTRNLAYGPEATAGVDALLAEPYGTWHVDGPAGTVQIRVTKRGQAQVHRAAGPTGADAAASAASHDRVKARLIDPGDPLFTALGADGAKRRQVDAFLRLLVPCLPALAGREPLQVVDLGCGNAYLSFAAYRFLVAQRAAEGAVRLTGVDLRDAARARNSELAARLEPGGALSFLAGTIADADLPPGDLVLALHACDTATDEALARAVRWAAPVIVAAPCCHHETALALRAGNPPAGHAALTRHGVLRERLADVLTDALRALLLRLLGYRVDVVEFTSTEHTARNVAIRAVRTGASATPELLAEYRDLTAHWGLRPALAAMLAPELTKRHGGSW